jgi:hypothetical protein
MVETERSERAIETVDAEIVALPRGKPYVAFSPDVKELAFRLWATVAGRRPAAVERLLARELPAGTAIPTQQAIGNWARGEDWAARADDLWRINHGAMLYELQLLTASNFLLSQIGKQDVLTGAYAGREMEGALILKAGELSDRLMERGVVPLIPVPPDTAGTDESHLSRAEREARAGERMARRKQDRP